MSSTNRLAFALLPLFALFSSLAIAENTQPAAGNYITEGGWGNLSISREAQGTLSFEINTVGSNGHSCSLQGNINNGRATPDGTNASKPCVVDFQPSNQGINVVPQIEECRYQYCGARANFDGLYLSVAPACEDKARENTRKKFKQLYSSKKYAEALATLEALLHTCQPTLLWTELGAIRNDISITQYHLGDFAGCLKTLQPYAADATKKDDELIENSPSVLDTEMYTHILDSARTNIKLCNGKLNK